MTYSKKFKKVVLNFKTFKIFTTKELANKFDISRTSIYNWKNGKHIKNKFNRNSKIKPNIKCYIRKYVLKKINFDRLKLKKLIQKNFNVKIGISTIYAIIKKLNITKKKIYIHKKNNGQKKKNRTN
jgi:transposase